MFARYVKAIAAVLGALTPDALIGIAQLAGWSPAPSTVIWVMSIASPVLALGATLAAPANAPKPLPAPGSTSWNR